MAAPDAAWWPLKFNRYGVARCTHGFYTANALTMGPIVGARDYQVLLYDGNYNLQGAIICDDLLEVRAVLINGLIHHRR